MVCELSTEMQNANKAANKVQKAAKLNCHDCRIRFLWSYVCVVLGPAINHPWRYWPLACVHRNSLPPVFGFESSVSGILRMGRPLVRWIRFDPGGNSGKLSDAIFHSIH